MQHWHAFALCRGMDPRIFFDEVGDYNEAKLFCQACPARAACLDYALATNQRHGCWGGLAPRARQELRRHLRLQVSA